jgi:hypothetical protein
MQFFLYEILARIVAIYLCVDCSRTLWSGLVERKITYVLGRSDLLNWLFAPTTKWTVERDAAPIRYWLTVGLQIFTLLACIVVVIFGWFHPDS